MIDKLEKQRKRLAKKPDHLGTMVEIVAATVPSTGPVTGFIPVVKPEPLVKAAEIDTGIPTFLQRKKLDSVAAEIVAEQAETKKKKAQGRIAKMKAKKSGETRKMPLTGKAALDAIRNG
jgi:hypothetical protein